MSKFYTVHMNLKFLASRAALGGVEIRRASHNPLFLFPSFPSPLLVSRIRFAFVPRRVYVEHRDFIPLNPLRPLGRREHKTLVNLHSTRVERERQLERWKG